MSLHHFHDCKCTTLDDIFARFPISETPIDFSRRLEDWKAKLNPFRICSEKTYYWSYREVPIIISHTADQPIFDTKLRVLDSRVGNLEWYHKFSATRRTMCLCDMLLRVIARSKYLTHCVGSICQPLKKDAKHRYCGHVHEYMSLKNCLLWNQYCFQL